MFGNKSSKDAVRRAVTRIKNMTNLNIKLFKLFPPYIDLITTLTQIIENHFWIKK